MNFEEAWQEQVIIYLGNPFDTRSITQFCRENNIDRGKYYRFVNKNRTELFKQIDRIREQFKSEIRSHAYKSLISRIPRSDNALKLAFQLLGDLVERSEVRTEHLTPEVKREKVRQLLERVSNELQNGPKSNDVDPGDKIDGSDTSKPT